MMTDDVHHVNVKNVVDIYTGRGHASDMSDPLESPTRVADAAQARADLAAKILADLETLSGMFPTDGDPFEQDVRGEGRIDEVVLKMRRAVEGMRDHVPYAAGRDQLRESMIALRAKAVS
jgi:hypothetical protein